MAPEALTQWLESHGEAVEAIVHMGAISTTTETDVDLIMEVNFRLSTQLWRWCAAHGKRLIYASSAATYGAGEHGCLDDDGTVVARPSRSCVRFNAYGWSKHLFDRWVASEASPAAARSHRPSGSG